jgi:hypothetical protein
MAPFSGGPESAWAMPAKHEMKPSTGDRNSRRLPGWLICLAYCVLFAIGIPWYWPAGSTRVCFGVPCWVVVAIAASAGVSVLTAVVLRRPWPGEVGGDHDFGRSGEDTR